MRSQGPSSHHTSVARSREHKRTSRTTTTVLTVVATLAAMLLAGSPAYGADRTWGSWGCGSTKFPAIESVAASPAGGSPEQVVHVIRDARSNFFSRTWEQPGARTFKYRLFQITSSHSANSGGATARSFDSAAPTCVF